MEIAMSTDNETKPAPSLAKGANLDPATWADFVARLRYDCDGPRVNDHCTAAALFTVQQYRTTYGLDPDYADGKVICQEDCEWASPQEYWDCLDEEERADFSDAYLADIPLLEMSESDQWELMESVEDVSVLGYARRWEIVDSHFTHEAAQAFIDRKGHDYPPLRIYVEAQIYCWEYEAIKAAILDGTLTYTPKSPADNAAAA